MQILTKGYWSQAKKELTITKKIAICAIMIALQISLSAVFIPVGDNLRIYFTFFITVLSSCICGPLLALISGFIVDILGYIIHPSGAFFFGYAISSMLSAFIYALFTYRTKITIVKLIFMKSIINMFINVMLGSLWTSMLYTKGYIYYASVSFIKNIILLPIEVLLLVILFKAVLPLLYKQKMTIINKVENF